MHVSLAWMTAEGSDQATVNTETPVGRRMSPMGSVTGVEGVGVLQVRLSWRHVGRITGGG